MSMPPPAPKPTTIVRGLVGHFSSAAKDKKGIAKVISTPTMERIPIIVLRFISLSFLRLYGVLVLS
jgi:hypothetical protein